MVETITVFCITVFVCASFISNLMRIRKLNDAQNLFAQPHHILYKLTNKSQHLFFLYAQLVNGIIISNGHRAEGGAHIFLDSRTQLYNIDPRLDVDTRTRSHTSRRLTHRRTSKVTPVCRMDDPAITIFTENQQKSRLARVRPVALDIHASSPT